MVSRKKLPLPGVNIYYSSWFNTQHESHLLKKALTNTNGAWGKYHTRKYVYQSKRITTSFWDASSTESTETCWMTSQVVCLWFGTKTRQYKGFTHPRAWTVWSFFDGYTSISFWVMWSGKPFWKTTPKVTLTTKLPGFGTYYISYIYMYRWFLLPSCLPYKWQRLHIAHIYMYAETKWNTHICTCVY